MAFISDNTVGAAPEILEALARVNDGDYGVYGEDEITRRVEEKMREAFERDVAVFLVTTGTAANGLALSSLTPPHGMILCHEASHIQTDEAGGPEFFCQGAKMLPLPGAGGKLTPDAVAAALEFYPADDPEIAAHRACPSTLSITQASEYGTLYQPSEIAALGELCRARGLSLHMDGARFANAVAGLDCAPADITWRAGVDALSFGATKNGALAAEAVIFFDRSKAETAAWRRKRAGHLWSKSRFLAAQWDACLEGDLWLKLARRANAMATRLAAGLREVDGVDLPYPTEANGVYATVEEALERRLDAASVALCPWVYPGDAHQGRLRRLVCSFATTEAAVDRFLDQLRAAAGAA